MSAIEQVPQNVRDTIYSTIADMGPFGNMKQVEDLAESFARHYLGELPIPE